MAVGRLYYYTAAIFLCALMTKKRKMMDRDEVSGAGIESGRELETRADEEMMESDRAGGGIEGEAPLSVVSEEMDQDGEPGAAIATNAFGLGMQPRLIASPSKLALGNLHKRRASTSPQKFNTGKFEPLPLRIHTKQETAERPTKRARIENKLEITYDALETPRVSAITPTFALPSGRKISGSKILNPRIGSASNESFSLFNAFLHDNDLLMQLVSYLPIPSLISFYAISKPFHYLFNGSYIAFILANMRTWAPGADMIYPWRYYAPLCIKDPRLRQKSSAVGKDVKLKYQDMRDIPSLRWLQMVIWRQGVCKDMLIQLAAQGLRCPPGTLDAIRRLWFIMDFPLNSQRVSLMRSEEYISKATISRATMFFFKVDMAFTDPVGPVYAVNGPHTNPLVHLPQWQNTGLVGCSLRALLTAERHFTPLWRVLRGICPDPDEPMLPIERLDILKLWVRHKYHLPEDTPEHVKHQSIFGVPWHEVGTAGMERTGIVTHKNADGTPKTIINPGLTSLAAQNTHREQQMLYPHQKRIVLPNVKPREVLLRPDELVMREGIRREMQLHTQWTRMMLWGFCDDLGRNLPVRSEEELLKWSRGNEPKSHYRTDAQLAVIGAKKKEADAKAVSDSMAGKQDDVPASAGLSTGRVDMPETPS
ncbi:hypothetical protein LTR56_016957 [Elasticomyces elasticus]|nr:hypothetical protein LTR56_016957 [Elasticomyces elasticus]KAK3640452.1 hypothetical protein LTR22_017009 [Elasticomyces elasticus]KAK4931169.1 hypothetical protein LTR49_002223 [Elasticomyces elasticus]KAK5767900.1 hypothetical protein LTS12_002056 [Elasticomyces elasticus]